MVRRDERLIEQLMLALEKIYKPGTMFHVTVPDETLNILGYSDEDIEEHLKHIRRRYYVEPAGETAAVGMMFSGFTETGHDYLDKIHEDRENNQNEEPAPIDVLEQLRAGIAELRLRMSELDAGNSEKAELAADLDQLTVEVDRPAPRRRFIKLFVESARDNLAKAGGAGIAGAALLLGGIVARWLHLT